jgi:hypothetical protein
MIPLILLVLIGLSLSLVALGVWQAGHENAGIAMLLAHDSVLLGLLLLAVFALGVFLGYALLLHF